MIENKTEPSFTVHLVDFSHFWAAIEFDIGMWSCFLLLFRHACYFCGLQLGGFTKDCGGEQGVFCHISAIYCGRGLPFVLINYWEQVYRGGILYFGYVQYFRYHNNLNSLP